jgi:hypothetical protein
MEKIKETELAAVVVDWLESQDWNVYQEVQFPGTGSADILAIKNDHIWVIETKTSFSFQVIAQAIQWEVSYRSVGVPENRRRDRGRTLAFQTCKHLEIGVIEVNVSNREVYNTEPTLHEGRFVEIAEKQILRELTIYHKNGVAGSTSGGAITPYKVTIMKVKEFIAANPGCTLKDIVSHIGNGHYSSESSAKNSLRSALENWEKDWCAINWNHREYTYTIKQSKETEWIYPMLKR